MHYIVISGKKENIKKARFKLWRMGFKKESPEQYLGAVKTQRQVNNIKKFCKDYKLKYRLNNGFGKRSGSYRKKFFKSFLPNASRGRWYCAYCGKKLKIHKVEVDHLYPVFHASKSLKVQAKMMRQGISNVNDIENLVPACKKCNRKKAAQMGLWIIRGKLGRHAWLWKIRNAIKNGLIMLLLYYLYQTGIIKIIYNFIVDVVFILFEVSLPVWA